MKTTRLGRTDVYVSELGFGAAPIGNLYQPVDDDVACASVDVAWDAGIRYFDTAPHYGLGLSERRLGRALRSRPRGDFAVSTKVGRLLIKNPNPTGSDLAAGFVVADDLARSRDYSRGGVLHSLDDSLNRMQLDRIDIAYVHDPEDHMQEAIREAIPALIELRDQRVIGAVGAGMNVVEPLRRIVAETDVDVVMIAGRWTLLDRSAAPLLDECAARNVSVVTAAPFNSGILTQQWPADAAMFDYHAAPPDIVARARDLATLCAKYGITMPHLAVQFAAHGPAVASVVAGMRTPQESEHDAQWITQQVPEAIWTEL